MKRLLAFTSLCLLGTLPLHASEPTAGGPPRAGDGETTPRGLGGVSRLRPAAYEPMPGWSTGGLPRWQMELGGRTYYLVFDGNKDLEQLVDKRRDVWWWKVRGRAERRDFALGRQPARPGDPVLKDARLLKLDVLVVESLEPTPLEAALHDKSVRVTVTAEIKWFGNSYGREPNGLIRGTVKWCPWESCYIVVNGRTIRVIGLPGDIVDQYGYRGQTMVLVGRMERRAEGAEVPPDMLIVERFQRG
jgi:hypothetical protein